MFSDQSPPPTGGIRLRGVTKSFDRAARKTWGLANPWTRPGFRKEVVALSDVDLDIAPGDAIGLIGKNGAGKSTLLKLLAGIVDPSLGSIECSGSVGSMIELGLGFHPELTGRENARGTATILGLSPEDADNMMPEITEFAGIEDAMDTPIKHYSTGMRARLGFAVSVHIPTDILLIDEVLAVGDAEFQMRCVDRVEQMRRAGTTIVFVSHATWLIATVCERVVHLRKGRVVDDGPSTEVIQRYLSPQPVHLGQSERPTMRFRHFEIANPRVAPWDELRLDAEVEVTDTTSEPAMGMEVNWATLAPDTTIARASAPLPPALRTPGRYRLSGHSSGLAVDSGHAQIRVALVDETSQRVLDRAMGELWITGTVTRQQPQIATEVEFAIECLDASGATGDIASSHSDAQHLLEADRAHWPKVAECRNVEKRFHAGLRRGGFRAALPSKMMPDERTGTVRALDSISFDIHAGECLGIIGPNGSGKSTILKCIAGVTAPTAGVIATRGRLVSMLELGLGFHDSLTGMENLLQTASLLGVSTAEIDAVMNRILDFADLGDAIDSPIKQYSTGMRARLGFALAVHAHPDLLLIDEALAVGDRPFQKRAVSAVRQAVADGAGAAFVSHDLELVEEICDRAIRLDHGRIVDEGPARDVVDRAGGGGWTGGVVQFTSPVRVDQLVLTPRQVPPGGRVDFEGCVEVTEPSPTVRIVFSLLVRTGNPNDFSPERLQRSTVFERTVVPAGGPLAQVGRYQFRGAVPRNPVLGELYAMVSAIDEREGAVTARVWQDLRVGNRIQMEVLTLPIELTWDSVEEIDPLRSRREAGT